MTGESRSAIVGLGPLIDPQRANHRDSSYGSGEAERRIVTAGCVEYYTGKVASYRHAKVVHHLQVSVYRAN